MLDIKFIRENPDLVKENIRKKFQNAKLPLVDEVIALDSERREAINEGEALKAERNKLSKANGPLFGRLKKCADEAEKAALQAEIDANNAAVKANAEHMARLEEKKANAEAAMNKLLLVIPQMIDESVPIGPDDSCNVEVERFGEPKTPDFPIPYHTEIMERFDGVDMDAAARVSGNGFYYLMGDIARLHSAVTAYGRDFMIDKGFTYCIPPFMIHGNVVEGVMSQTDMDAMMYKIEGEEFLDKVVGIDQSPIGRTPRSNPATYTGLFNEIRNLFAATQEAKARGYGPGRFSFNTKGGRCEACCGDGMLKIEMHFLSDVYVPCEVCHGKRYNRETLEVKYKGRSISDVLDMTAEEALEFFAPVPKIAEKLLDMVEISFPHINCSVIL